MRRLNSSHWALITLLGFVSVEIPEHMAWLWTLLLAPCAHAQSMEQGHPALPALHEDLRPWIPALTEGKKIKTPHSPPCLPREFSTSQPRLLEGKANKTQCLSWKPPGSSGQRAGLPHRLWEVLTLPLSSQGLSPAPAPTAQPSQCLHLTQQRADDLLVCLHELGSPHTVISRLHTHICKKILILLKIISQSIHNSDYA